MLNRPFLGIPSPKLVHILWDSCPISCACFLDGIPFSYAVRLDFIPFRHRLYVRIVPFVVCVHGCGLNFAGLEYLDLHTPPFANICKVCSLYLAVSTFLGTF
ncbi:MAG: hypothetical protein IJS96_05305, partial [Schwartzia sp.]|nr:hypothetical protein [Schwartzia sp. (in: firmicutes)]